MYIKHLVQIKLLIYKYRLTILEAVWRTFECYRTGPLRFCGGGNHHLLFANQRVQIAQKLDCQFLGNGFGLQIRSVG
jgi:hypothetical protein